MEVPTGTHQETQPRPESTGNLQLRNTETGLPTLGLDNPRPLFQTLDLLQIRPPQKHIWSSHGQHQRRRRIRYKRRRLKRLCNHLQRNIYWQLIHFGIRTFQLGRKQEKFDGSHFFILHTTYLTATPPSSYLILPAEGLTTTSVAEGRRKMGQTK